MNRKTKSMLKTVAAVKNILCDKATHTMRVFHFIVAWLYSNCNKIKNKFLKRSEAIIQWKV